MLEEIGIGTIGNEHIKWKIFPNDLNSREQPELQHEYIMSSVKISIQD
jgi:hypothetical protein